MNVEVAAAVPLAALNVTATPLCQLPLLNVIEVGLAVIAVLPERVSVTVTLLEGAALSRNVDVPLAPVAQPHGAAHRDAGLLARPDPTAAVGADGLDARGLVDHEVDRRAAVAHRDAAGREAHGRATTTHFAVISAFFAQSQRTFAARSKFAKTRPYWFSTAASQLSTAA